MFSFHARMIFNLIFKWICNNFSKKTKPVQNGQVSFSYFNFTKIYTGFISRHMLMLQAPFTQVGVHPTKHNCP